MKKTVKKSSNSMNGVTPLTRADAVSSAVILPQNVIPFKPKKSPAISTQRKSYMPVSERLHQSLKVLEEGRVVVQKGMQAFKKLLASYTNVLVNISEAKLELTDMATHSSSAELVKYLLTEYGPECTVEGVADFLNHAEESLNSQRMSAEQSYEDWSTLLETYATLLTLCSQKIGMETANV